MRHGNTFAPGDPVVWAGSKNDLALVSSGEEQARSFGAFIRLHDIRFDAVYSSPLQRAKRFAEIALESAQSNLLVQVDTRLNEIDYGPWTGLTNEHVEKQFGAQAQKNWNECSRWPEAAGWGGSEAVMIASVKEFSENLLQKHSQDDCLMLVSSNGTLRYFLKLVEGAFEASVAAGTFKVRTGAYCVMQHQNGRWQVESWNQRPGE